MPYQPILATLGYVLSPDGKQVLMIRRDKRLDDTHYGKCNGLGGKLERDEDIVSGMCREIREEAGIECASWQLRGTINWPGFGKGGEDWFGFVFLITAFQGTPLKENDEGSLIWIDRDRWSELPLWEGDRHFLPLVLGPEGPPFHAVMPYREGRLVSWSVK